MHVDDRLATVLHHRAAGERAARVQFRQLLDLLGESVGHADPVLTRAAFRRLDALATIIPLAQRERIAAECSARIRNPALLGWFASQEPKLALAALSRAALSEDQWTLLIPEIPARARGLLRHRRNLPARAQTLLDRLGVRDRVLPEPMLAPPEIVLDDWAEMNLALEASPAAAPALDLGASPDEIYVLEPDISPADEENGDLDRPLTDTSNLAELVKRIEAFQRARAARSDPTATVTSGSPNGESEGTAENTVRPRIESFLFTADVTGRIDWAEGAALQQVVGTMLVSAEVATNDGSANSLSSAFARRQPVTGSAMTLAGAEQVAGSWIVEAAPRFRPRAGTFEGYVGRFRRPTVIKPDSGAIRTADRLRQLLHELRTPVTAIQGFAEVIQQQTVGAVPHEYRALAAEIAGDAARMLAGFAELERLAQLEAGIQDFSEGVCDFATVVRRQITQLQTVLSPRVARIEASWHLREARVALAPENAELLAWRFLGTLAAVTVAGERITVEFDAIDDVLHLTAALPAALSAIDDVFASDIRSAGVNLGTGLFGAGFALRLARAEARAGGGDLIRKTPETMLLTLPLGDGSAMRGDAPEATAASTAVRKTAAARLP